jgi:hypothetical protein
VGEPAAESEGGTVMRDPLSRGSLMGSAQRQRKLEKSNVKRKSAGLLIVTWALLAFLRKAGNVALSISN